MLYMALVETSALRGQRVHIGCRRKGMAIAAYTLGAQFVRHKEDKIHFQVTIGGMCTDLLLHSIIVDLCGLWQLAFHCSGSWRVSACCGQQPVLV